MIIDFIGTCSVCFFHCNIIPARRRRGKRRRGKRRLHNIVEP
jgi:hypothetical protein